MVKNWWTIGRFGADRPSWAAKSPLREPSPMIGEPLEPHPFAHRRLRPLPSLHRRDGALLAELARLAGREASRARRHLRRKDRRHACSGPARRCACWRPAPATAGARERAVRELGRISGYIETMVEALEQHLDGRKLTGVKRRLELLRPGELHRCVVAGRKPTHIDRLASAEGYFRALADGLRM